MKIKPITLDHGSGSVSITREQLAQFIPEADIDKGESRGKLKTIGPWQIPKAYTALAVSKVWQDMTFPHYPISTTIYGIKTLCHIQESGYQLEGKVSIDGKKHRAFTSNQLFQLENGHLVNIAVIYVCNT